jgi:serine/threonine protein kinase
VSSSFSFATLHFPDPTDCSTVSLFVASCSVGCVVLELATGKKPWHSAENEWAIMYASLSLPHLQRLFNFSYNPSTHLISRYKIGAGELPPLPDPDQISEAGVDFVLCTLTMNAEERPTADELLNHHPCSSQALSPSLFYFVIHRSAR